jgi:hypothetical protein
MRAICLIVLCLNLLPFLAHSAPAENSPAETTNHFVSLFQEQFRCATLPELLRPLLKRQQGLGFEVAFKEEKRIQLLKRPLHSAGELVFLPDKGLYRKLTQPFRQELIVNRDFILHRDDDGEITRMATDKQPVARAFTESFLTLFSGSWPDLTNRFDANFTATSQGWQLGLRPKLPVMAKIISAIVIEGQGDQLHRLWVIEANGDLTVDDYLQPKFLTPDQARERLPLFQWPK